MSLNWVTPDNPFITKLVRLRFAAKQDAYAKMLEESEYPSTAAFRAAADARREAQAWRESEDRTVQYAGIY